MNIIPYFQPIYSMSKKDIYGFEILARGMARDGRLVLPKDLFSNVDNRRNRDIDLEVREKAFQRIAGFPDEGHYFFFNVPPDYFLDIKDVGRDSRILRLCEKHGIDPGRIVIEITEKAATGEGFKSIASSLKEYARLGFTIAIDDWGAEHSNFDRLAMLIPGIVKFDARFLWKATGDPNTAEIFSSAVSMASKLGISVIAEGVEKAEHLYMALDAGSPMAQGFYLGRPGPSILEDADRKRYHRVLNRSFLHYREGKIRHLLLERESIDCLAKSVENDLRSCNGRATSQNGLSEIIPELMEKNSEIIKAYVLDAAGIQISRNFTRTNGCISHDPEMLHRDWSWRPYFLETLVNKRLYRQNYTITGPYVDPEISKSVFTVCIVIKDCMVCVDFDNESA